MARYPELARILAEKSLKRGHFVLASGRTSDHYIDGKLTSFDPIGSKLIVEAILNEIQDLKVDAVGGMDMGGTPIVGALANRLGNLGRSMPCFVVRKEVKSHGTMKLVEGNLPAPCNVVLLEDVITTGESVLKAVKAVRDLGCTVTAVICVLDRNAGARQMFSEMGVSYLPLTTLEDIGIK